jgi:hypothetical protein
MLIADGNKAALTIGTPIGAAAIAGSSALVENSAGGLFATVSAVSWLAYFLWIAAASIGLIRVSRVPAQA